MLGHRFPSLLLLSGLLLGSVGPSVAQGVAKWRIEAHFSGTATASTPNPVGGVGNTIQGQSVGNGQNGTRDLSTIQNYPEFNYNGLTAQLAAQTYVSISSSSCATGLTGSGTVTFTINYIPANGEPPPSMAFVCVYRQVVVRAKATARYPSGLGQANVSGTAFGLSNSTSASANYSNGDQDTGNLSTVDINPLNASGVTLTNGQGTITYPFTLNLTASANATPSPGYGIGQGWVTAYIHLAVMNNAVGRDNGDLSGNESARGVDPTFTRWLPLSFSPTVSSHPFRWLTGPLPGPWGNVNCMYSISVLPEQAGLWSPNYDLRGEQVVYAPSIGPDGTINTPSPPYHPMLASSWFIPRVFIPDVDGSRLVFGDNDIKHADVHSDFTTLRSINGTLLGYRLANAGPPGQLHDRGRYTYAFDTAGKLTSISDDIGNQQTLDWSNGLVVTDSSSGRQLVFTMLGGWFGSVDAPGAGGLPGTHTTLWFDANGHLGDLRVYLSGSFIPIRTDSFTYGGSNGDSLITSSQSGSIASYTWFTDDKLKDPFGFSMPRLASATYGNAGDTSSSDNGQSIQGTESFTYGDIQVGYANWGPGARTNTYTDARGYTTTLLYTVWDLMWGAITSIKLTGPDYTGAPVGSNIVKVSYSSDASNPTAITLTDPFNTAWGLNLSQGNVTKLTDPTTAFWQFDWNQNGSELTKITDPTSLAWALNYGENGAPQSRLTSVVDPGNLTRITAWYNAFGQPEVITVPANASATGQAETTQLAYSSPKGDLIQATSPLNDSLTVNSYDALGDPLSVSVFPDTGNPATTLTPLTSLLNWDAAQQLIQAQLPNGVLVTNTWTNGLVTRVKSTAPGTGATLSQMDFLYDTRGRLYSATDLVGSAAQYKYDKNSNLRKILDGKANATVFTYGPVNEPTAVTWPGGQSASAQYDAGGRVRSTTDERGIVSNYFYDAAWRLTDVQFPAYSSQNVHVVYDFAGRPTYVSDATGSTTLTYEATRRRLTNVATYLGGHTYNVAYAYYPDGKVQTMTSPAGTTSYSYDKSGRLTSITNPYGQTTSWTYDHMGRMTSQSTNTGSATVATSYVWGVSGQTGDPSTAPAYLRQIVQSVNGQAIRTYTLTHSYLGQLLTRVGSGTGGMTESAAYGYDSRGRLNGETKTYSNNGQNYSTAGIYQYDLANNLMGGFGWTYNTNNQLTSAPPIQNLSGATGLTYDSAGNLLTANGMAFSYNAWGYLSQVTGTPQGTASYTYDAFGRRVSKSVGGTTTYFLYDGDALIGEFDPGGSLTKSYTWGEDGLISDNLGGASDFFLYDDEGDTRDTVNPSGTLTAAAEFAAYNACMGPIINSNAAAKAKYGGYTDSETDLIYQPGGYYYAPSMGVWIQPAAPGFTAGNPYAYGDPINGEDDDGIDWNHLNFGQSIKSRNVQRGLNNLANGMAATLNTAAYFNPLAVGVMAWTGRDATNKKLSKGEQLMLGATLVTGPIGSGLRKLRELASLPGYVHHVLSNPIMKALGRHETLAGIFNREDPRFITRAKNLLAHIGWQRWHRAVDKEVEVWLEKYDKAPAEDFLSFLGDIYNRKKLQKRFPGYSPPATP